MSTGSKATAIAYFHLAKLENDARNKAGARECAQAFLSRYTANDAFRREAEAISSGK